MVLQHLSLHIRNVGFRRWKGTAAKLTQPASVKNIKKKYTSTVLLPKTAFPRRVEDGKTRRELDETLRASIGMDTLYAQQRESRATQPEFLLHDGPPYANGDVHVGHAVNKILKDITNRYKLLSGFRVHYKPGWDCHGLPIELKALERLGLQTSSASPQAVREVAREIVKECSNKQRDGFASWGVMADWTDNVYLTTDPSYEAKQIELFGRLFERGLIYRELKPVYWSPSSQTSLAEAELEYKNNHESTAVFVAFPVPQPSDVLKRLLPVTQQNLPWFAVIWTTTPWSIPANQAIAFSPAMQYVLVPAIRNGVKGVYLLGQDELTKVKGETDLELIEEPVAFSGQLLMNLTYSHALNQNEICPFIPADHVTGGKGTGLVHTAPSHGHDDFLVGLKHNLNNTTCLVDIFGKFVKEAGVALEGKDVLSDGTEAVIDLLQTSGLLLGRRQFVHSYPYDWRTKKPVILRASEQWFIDVEKIRQPALDALEKVIMIPKSGKDIMASQLKSRPYWCISRQRMWGVPIPVFYSADGRPLINNTSIKHIAGVMKERGADVWWTGSDEVLFPNSVRQSLGLKPKDKIFKGSDILDIWFESGTSWAAVLGEEKIADLYIEGHDQYGAWFQTSLLTSVALRNEAPFKKVFVHGFALDENGKKMSKSLGNVVHPDSVTQQYGVDVLRWWVAQGANGSTSFLIGPAVLDGIKENLAKFRNTFRFLLGSLEGYQRTSESEVFPVVDGHLIDMYGIHVTTTFVQAVREHYENMEYNKVTQEVVSFVNGGFLPFYLTFIKDRMYCDAQESTARRSVQFTLDFILQALMDAMAPITPFLIEEVQGYTTQPQSDSVRSLSHSTSYFASANDWLSQLEMLSRGSFVEAAALSVRTVDLVLQMRDCVNQVFAAQNMAQLRLNLQLEKSNGVLVTGLQKLLQSGVHADSGCSDLHDLFGVSEVRLLPWREKERDGEHLGEVTTAEREQLRFKFSAESAAGTQCGRCRKFNVTGGGELCNRCLDVIGQSWNA